MTSQDDFVVDLLHRLSTQPQAETLRRDGHGRSRAPSMEEFVDAMQLLPREGLRDAVLVAKDMDAIANTVQESRSLVLSGSSLGDSGLSVLIGALKESSRRNSANLLHLDLSNNGITRQGFEEFARAMETRVLPNLTNLNMSQNPLGDGGVDKLSRVLRTGHHSSLQTLDFSHCNIGDMGMVSFADSLQSGNFSAWGLQSLDFSANFFGERGVAALARAISMGRLPALRNLNLSHNWLGEQGTVALSGALNSGKQVGQITHLLLARCSLGGELVPLFQAMETGNLPGLQALDVSGNQIGEGGSAALAMALRSGRMSAIQHLNLSQCGVGAQEVKFLANAIEVGQVRDLRFLDLSRNPLDSSSSSSDGHRNHGNSSVPHHLPKLNHPLDSSFDGYRNHGNFSVPPHLPKLNDRGSVALAGLMSRRNLSHLQHLDLSQCWIDDHGLIALADSMATSTVPFLQRFFFQGNEITSKRSIKAVVGALESGRLANLEELELGLNSMGEDVNLALASALQFSSAQGPLVDELRTRLRRNSLSDGGRGVGDHMRRYWENRSFRGLEAVTVVEETAKLQPAAKIFNQYLERQYSKHLTPIVDEEIAPSSTARFFFNVAFLCAWLVAVLVTRLW